MNTHSKIAPDPQQFSSQPETLIQLSQEEIFGIPLEDQKDIQLQGARKRFHELREGVSMIARLAEEQSVTEIRTLDDLAPLLVPHSALKSYPMSFLEKSQFDRLTKWLDSFTSHDLSALDVKDCDSIDDWLDILDAKTEMRVLHSTGTTGKLSFVPRSTVEMHHMATLWASKLRWYLDQCGMHDTPVGAVPSIYASYRHGGMAFNRLLNFLVADMYDGDESMVLAANPGRMSADAASISGRIRVAEAKGELGKMQISPKLMARRDQLIADQKNAPAMMDTYLESIIEKYSGKIAAVTGALPSLYHIASEGVKRGYENVLSPHSLIQLGGGMKGQVLPDDWYETILRFFGVPQMLEGYGMTELTGGSFICSEGHFHLPAWQIPFMLDPVTGRQYPRTGEQKGRFGFYDLNAETYWGGFLSGDEVTLSWGDLAPCGCGRIGPYVHRGIRRYSESEGGDDKITCAGAPEAYDKAIDFILQSAG